MLTLHIEHVGVDWPAYKRQFGNEANLRKWLFESLIALDFVQTERLLRGSQVPSFSEDVFGGSFYSYLSVSRRAQ